MDPILLERLVVVEQKATAAHSRMDKFEISVAESLKDISSELRAITTWMHETKGRDRIMFAVIGAISALLGGAAGALIPLLFK